MKHARRLLPASLIIVQALLLAWGAVQHGPVIDEPAHLAAGISNWQLAGFELFKVNPPLVRMIAALPAIAAGAKTDWSGYFAGIGARPEFAVMHDFVRANGPRVLWLVTLARWALIPLVLLGGYICYRWARELYGDAAGIVALVLWCFSPNVLAYGQVINADAGATALGITAAYFFWKWLRDPAWDRALVAGIVLGLAELTKTTWVVLFGLWPVLWLAVRFGGPSQCKMQIAKCKTQNDASGSEPDSDDPAPKNQHLIAYASARNPNSKIENPESRRPHPSPLPEGEGTSHAHDPSANISPPNPKSKIENPKCNEVAQLAMMVALAVFCINAGYDFEGSGTRLGNYLFVSRPLIGVANSQRAGNIGNRFATSWLGKLPVPLPRSYVEGIDLQWHDIEMGKPSYLRGRWQARGWWYWYLYALALKVPLGTWGLLLLAVGVRVAGCSQKSKVQGPKSLAWKAESDSVRPHPSPLPEGEGVGVTWKDEAVLLAHAAAVLVLVSSQTGFSRYIRYVLPILPFVFIWISSVGALLGVRRFIAAVRRRGATFACRETISTLARIDKVEGGCAATESGDESPRSKIEGGDESARSRIIGLATVLLLGWSVASSLWYAPHWMSYFNELAGGPMGGPAHLIDAQVDWGQDLLYLKKWLAARPEARPLGVVYFGPLSPTVAGIDFVVPPKGALLGNDRIELARLPSELKPGWYAVSVNYLYGYPHYIYGPSGKREWVPRPYYSYFRRFQPVATAGYSIYIYHLTPEQIDAAMHDQAGRAGRRRQTVDDRRPTTDGNENRAAGGTFRRLSASKFWWLVVSG